MIECLVSWIVILITSYLWGYASLGGFVQVSRCLTRKCKTEEVDWQVDDYIMAGMCMLTVYAQVFSVLYRVGEIVLVVVIAADIIILFVVKAQLTVELKQYFHSENRLNTIFAGIVCVIVGVIVSKLTALPAGHYDSSLYHAQSIRWIEEYGVVKGLGNLHNRFAYNSAFFCLQALFSFSFLLGKSLHTINGFIAAIFLCYALCSAKVWKNKRVTVSDFLRLGLIAHIISESAVFSSPGSDILSVGLVLYIVFKWFSYKDDRRD